MSGRYHLHRDAIQCGIPGGAHQMHIHDPSAIVTETNLGTQL
jgi:hypothetical protein